MKLKMTEHDQSETVIEELIEIIEMGEDDEIPAIVARENGEIIDGHHRAVAYERCGVQPSVVMISDHDYEVLVDAGFDRMVIAAAAYILDGDTEFGPVAIDTQFQGAGILSDAWDAVDILEG